MSIHNYSIWNLLGIVPLKHPKGMKYVEKLSPNSLPIQSPLRILIVRVAGLGFDAPWIDLKLI